MTVIGLFFLSSLQAATFPFKVEEAHLQERVVIAGGITPLQTESIKARYSNFIRKLNIRVGQPVKKGELLAEVDTQWINQQKEYQEQALQFAQSNLAQAQFNEKQVKQKQIATRQLASKDLIPKSGLDSAQMAMLDTQLRVIAAQQEIDRAKKDLELTKKMIQNLNYYASMDGVVTSLLVNPEQLLGPFWLNEGIQLARIDAPGKYVVKATATDTQVNKIKVGDQCEAYLEGYEGSTPCKISSMNRLKELSHSSPLYYEVTILLEKPGAIPPRQLLTRIEIPLEKRSKELVVPWNAVHLKANQAMVRVIGSEGISEREVILGTRESGRVGIRQGLHAGEIVEAELW